MHPIFGIAREHTNSLIINEYRHLPMASFHFHSQLELILIEKGEVEVLINGKRKLLAAPSAAIATSYQPHGFLSRGECLASIIFIPTHLCEDFIAATENRAASTPFIEDGETVSIIDFCFKKLRSAGLNKIEEIGYLNVMLGSILNTLTFDKISEPLDSSLTSRLLFYISENYKNDLTAESIAAHFGYSKDYVSKCFRSALKVSISEYLTTVRLKNALLLMQDGKMNIIDCALESGFNSTRTFYRAFAQEFGCSPKEYLKENKD